MAKKPHTVEVFPHHGKWWLWNPSGKVFAVADNADEREKYMGMHFQAMAKKGVHVDFVCWNNEDAKAALTLESGKSWSKQEQHWPTFKRKNKTGTAATPAAPAAPAAPPTPPKPPRKRKTETASTETPTAALIPPPPAPPKSPKTAPAAPATGTMNYTAFVADFFAKHAGKGKALTDAAAAWKKYKKAQGLG